MLFQFFSYSRSLHLLNPSVERFLELQLVPVFRFIKCSLEAIVALIIPSIQHSMRHVIATFRALHSKEIRESLNSSLYDVTFLPFFNICGE
jgi:hypothetical protein